MKKLDKIINATEFLVQKKDGGYKGWNVYARHKKWSKYSVSIVQDKKPILTSALKNKIVSMAIEDLEIEKHNMPLWNDLDRNAYRSKDSALWFVEVLFNKKGVYEKVLKLLEDNCEMVAFNEVMQRLKDARCEALDYSKTRAKIKPRLDREIK